MSRLCKYNTINELLLVCKYLAVKEYFSQISIILYVVDYFALEYVL